MLVLVGLEGLLVFLEPPITLFKFEVVATLSVYSHCLTTMRIGC
jgi:hypothetical protein